MIRGQRDRNENHSLVLNYIDHNKDVSINIVLQVVRRLNCAKLEVLLAIPFAILSFVSFPAGSTHMIVFCIVQGITGLSKGGICT